MPATSQLDWLSSTTAMIVLFWSRATRDLLRSFGWGIAALHRLDAATKLPPPRRPPHRILQFRANRLHFDVRGGVRGTSGRPRRCGGSRVRRFTRFGTNALRPERAGCRDRFVAE